MVVFLDHGTDGLNIWGQYYGKYNAMAIDLKEQSAEDKKQKRQVNQLYFQTKSVFINIQHT